MTSIFISNSDEPLEAIIIPKGFIEKYRGKVVLENIPSIKDVFKMVDDNLRSQRLANRIDILEKEVVGLNKIIKKLLKKAQES